LDYRIEFWNEEGARVPTQDAIIFHALDPNVWELSSFEMTQLGFLDWHQEASGKVIDIRIDCRPEMNIAVEVRAGLGMEIPGFAHNADITDSTLVWWFHAVDPTTGEYPEDPMAGFLPPFDPETGEDIGWVEFTVEPKEGLSTGTEIGNVAYVEFDFLGDLYEHPAPKDDEGNPNPWINTIDAGAGMLTDTDSNPGDGMLDAVAVHRLYGDVDGDWDVDLDDWNPFVDSYGSWEGDPISVAFDHDRDGDIDFSDFVHFAYHYGREL
jgi:hypothetical protein